MSVLSGLPLFRPVHSQAVEAAALEVLRSGQIASGPKVGEFEREFAALTGRPHMVSTSDMTSALSLALHLSGVGAGDDVATLAYSCMSSNSPIARLGANAVWVDIDEATASMSVDDLERKLTRRTKAVMLYHVAGYPGPAREIAALCRSRGISLIEDCNNALGASQDGVPLGRVGDFAVWSFYPNRQINALEGGALACPNTDIAARARKLRRFGIDSAAFRDSLGEIDPRADIPEVGLSASFSQLNAAIGLAQFADLDGRLLKTRQNAAQLNSELARIPGLTPVRPSHGGESAYWAFLMLVDDRDQLLGALKRAGIGASKLHHRNDDYSGFHATSHLPCTGDFMRRVIGLPCGWWLESQDIVRVAAAVRSCLA
jgi:dTDP-4-amino-4,6-dideoxygalactose transaminase